MITCDHGEERMKSTNFPLTALSYVTSADTQYHQTLHKVEPPTPQSVIHCRDAAFSVVPELAAFCLRLERTRRREFG